MERLVSWVTFGALGTCLSLASACSSKTTAPLSGDGEDGGGGGATPSNGGSGNQAPSGGGGSGGTSGGATSGGGQATGPSSGISGASTGSAGSGTTAASGSTDDSGTAAACSATMSPGAIPLATNFLAPNVIGDGGYAYAYSDAAKGGASSSCVDELALCGDGMTGAMSTATWGAGIGVNLNQVMSTSSASPPIGMFAATGGGISYTLTNLPSQGARIIIDNGGMDYCAPLSAAMGEVKWADFNLTCWAPTPAGDLSGAPSTATHINFQVDAAAAAAPFDFCVTAVAFAP